MKLKAFVIALILSATAHAAEPTAQLLGAMAGSVNYISNGKAVRQDGVLVVRLEVANNSDQTVAWRGWGRGSRAETLGVLEHGDQKIEQHRREGEPVGRIIPKSGELKPGEKGRDVLVFPDPGGESFTLALPRQRINITVIRD